MNASTPYPVFAVLSTPYPPFSTASSSHLAFIFSTCQSVCRQRQVSLLHASHILLDTLRYTHKNTLAPLHGNLTCHAHQPNLLRCKTAVTAATSCFWWSGLVSSIKATTNSITVCRIIDNGYEWRGSALKFLFCGFEKVKCWALEKIKDNRSSC